MNFEFETADIHFTMEGSGPALVFLHGLGGHSGNWLYQRRHFARTWTVICPDMPGQGLSTGRDIPFRRYADVLHALLGSLKVRRCAIVGLSKGARVGLSLAARSPRFVSSLVLVNTFVCLTSEDMKKRVDLYELLANGDGGHEWASQLVRFMGIERNPPLVHGFMRTLAKIDPDHIRRIFLEVIDYDQRLDLQKVDAPVLILRGEVDYFVPAYCASYLSGCLPQSESIAMRECGHLPYLEQPDDFNKLVEGFLNRYL